VRETLVPLPPLAEQGAIVEIVEDQLSVVEHLRCELAHMEKSAQGLRQSVLGAAFAGHLVPQDPNDEPASELLKRIAAERETRAHEASAAKRGADRGARRSRGPVCLPSHRRPGAKSSKKNADREVRATKNRRGKES